jgi:cytochrome oxidase Cu insertion factor (SCO1/SenC/PrrC family)
LKRRRRPRLRRSLALAAAALGAVVGVALHFALTSSHSTAFALPPLNGQAVWQAGERRAPPFALRDQNGRLVSLDGERGHTVLLAFLDPRCPRRCAIEATGLALAEEQVPAQQRGALLIVSLEADATRVQVESAAHRWGLVGNWHWLLGGHAQLERVWRTYGIHAETSPGAIAADTAVYIIDTRGFERVGVHAPFLPQFLADDLRALALRRR